MYEGASKIAGIFAAFISFLGRNSNCKTFVNCCEYFIFGCLLHILSLSTSDYPWYLVNQEQLFAYLQLVGTKGVIRILLPFHRD
jgi:hypothetical protein